MDVAHDGRSRGGDSAGAAPAPRGKRGERTSTVDSGENREEQVASRPRVDLGLDSRREPAAAYGFVLLSFFASELLARALGVRFASETLGTLYQYLDPEILRADLARGLYYLHAQTPLFNLGLGLVLKLFPQAFALLMGAAALALLAAMTWLLRQLGASPWVSGAVCFCFAISPNFIVYRNWLFYTLPVALLLAGCGIALLRYCGSGRRLPLVSFAVLTFAVMMTRSLYHPLWLVAVVLATLPFLDARRRRGLAIASLVSLLAVNLWFLKNLALVGSYSGSTWLGLSLAKRWPLSQEEVMALKDSGVIPPYWHRRPFQEPRVLTEHGFFEEGDTTVHPALDEPYKTNGEPNFNHRDYVEISDSLLKGNLRLIRLHPGRYLERTATALLLFLQPGPNSVHFLVPYDFDPVHRYRDFLTRHVLLGGRVERPIRMLEPSPNLLIVIFPLLLGVGIWSLGRGPLEQRALHAFMLVTVLWVTVVANLVEIGENDRMRWEIEPFLAIWIPFLGTALCRRLGSSTRARKAVTGRSRSHSARWSLNAAGAPVP
jgi:hypothetical protein